MNLLIDWLIFRLLFSMITDYLFVKIPDLISCLIDWFVDWFWLIHRTVPSAAEFKGRLPWRVHSSGQRFRVGTQADGWRVDGALVEPGRAFVLAENAVRSSWPVGLTGVAVDVFDAELQRQGRATSRKSQVYVVLGGGEWGEVHAGHVPELAFAGAEPHEAAVSFRAPGSLDQRILSCAGQKVEIEGMNFNINWNFLLNYTVLSVSTIFSSWKIRCRWNVTVKGRIITLNATIPFKS